MSPVNSMFVCIIKKKKKKKKKIIGKSVLKMPISIIGKMLNIGADNRSTPSTMFLGLGRVSCIAVYAESESSRISSNIS